jgi:GT2 family glycosyltransferase
MNKISIVCATHNKIKQLIRTIHSLTTSEKIIYEIIICSTDKNDFNIVQKEFKKIFNFVFIYSDIKSQTYQRSLAIKKAKSIIILQIDDDVIVSQGTIKKMLDCFDMESNQIVVGAYLLYPNNDHVSKRFTSYYKKSIFLQLIYFLLNLFKQPNQMSVLRSGRIFPLLDDPNSNKEWLSSFLMYTKNSYYQSDVHFNLGKGYYEDIIFTHRLYKLGYKLIMIKDAIVKIDYNQPTSLKTYLKSLPMQFHFVKLFKKNYILFFIDIVIFSFIHLFISIKKKYE